MNVAMGLSLQIFKIAADQCKSCYKVDLLLGAITREEEQYVHLTLEVMKGNAN